MSPLYIMLVLIYKLAWGMWTKSWTNEKQWMYEQWDVQNHLVLPKWNLRKTVLLLAAHLVL